MSQIGKPDCRGGDRRRKREKIEIERGRKSKKRKACPRGGIAPKTSKNGVTICGMMKAAKTKHLPTGKNAVRKYSIQHEPGTFLTFRQRQILARDWNELIKTGRRITIRQFAAMHGLSPETWRREYHRGAAGIAIPDTKDRRRRKYAEYDPFAAQDKINENNDNKGTRMLVTNQMAYIFKKHVIDENGNVLARMCPTTDLWKKTVAENTKRLFD